jgi:Protein of unknown function (DUF3127).
MQITAKLSQLLPLQTGTGKNGPWKKQDIIVETEAAYPKKICISIWGDKIDASQLQPGNQLKIDFDLESREFNGRWYTDVKAWKIEVASGSAPAVSDEGVTKAGMGAVKEEDDLPF